MQTSNQSSLEALQGLAGLAASSRPAPRSPALQLAAPPGGLDAPGCLLAAAAPQAWKAPSALCTAGSFRFFLQTSA